MGIHTGSEFIASLRDERTIYVNRERLSDVTTYPPFTGVIATLASLYDLNHERPVELTFASPTDGTPVALSFLMAETLEQVEHRQPPGPVRVLLCRGPLRQPRPLLSRAGCAEVQSARDTPARRERGRPVRRAGNSVGLPRPTPSV
jgi:4-hydroxyphenylacetate 3-hydroxylase-like protein